MNIDHKEALRLLRITFAQATALSDNENIYDDNEGDSVPVEHVRQFLEAALDGDDDDFKIEDHVLEEGYYTIVSTELSTDCDHGPCAGVTLNNGWIMWVYPEKPKLISFHPNFISQVEGSA